MPRRRVVSSDPDAEFEARLREFRAVGGLAPVRERVVAFVPAYVAFRKLGISLVADGETGATAARDRIENYLRAHPRTVVSGLELEVISGIGEWARRVRELRVEKGYRILTKKTVEAMRNDDASGELPASMKPDDYFLADTEPDKAAARRWHRVREIRRSPIGAKERMLAFLKEFVGEPVTGEELREVSGGATEWARRLRELRQEEGWALRTRDHGRPDLPVGVYVLEHDRQANPVERRIPDAAREATLLRDGYACRSCGWTRAMATPDSAKVRLELHHFHEFDAGGPNVPDNLVTLCNVCHDRVHAKDIKSPPPVEEIIQGE